LPQGTVKPLAKRVPDRPDVPTIAETGYRSNEPRPSVMRRRPAIAVGPAGLSRQRNHGLSPDLVPRRGAEFERLQPAAKQIQRIDGLRALITAIEHLRRKHIGAILPANADILRP